jgi:hypothetical protein
MATMFRRWGAVAVAGAGLMFASGCAGPLGHVLDDVVGPTMGRNTIVQGEVRSVDTRNGRIQIREHYGGNRTLRVDNRTRIVYQNRNHSLRSVSRGDIVRARVVYDRRGTPWADRIDIHRDSRDRGAIHARTERVDGTVAWVDHRAGSFSLRQNRGGAVVVHVPRNVSRNDDRRFDRLRRGDRVRVEVRSVGRNQVQLVRFR